jgi:alkylhydroperoxidase family enzyme
VVDDEGPDLDHDETAAALQSLWKENAKRDGKWENGGRGCAAATAKTGAKRKEEEEQKRRFRKKTQKRRSVKARATARAIQEPKTIGRRNTHNPKTPPPPQRRRRRGEQADGAHLPEVLLVAAVVVLPGSTRANREEEEGGAVAVAAAVLALDKSCVGGVPMWAKWARRRPEEDEDEFARWRRRREKTTRRSVAVAAVTGVTAGDSSFLAARFDWDPEAPRIFFLLQRHPKPQSRLPPTVPKRGIRHPALTNLASVIADTPS